MPLGVALDSVRLIGRIFPLKFSVLDSPLLIIDNRFVPFILASLKEGLLVVI